MHTLYLSEQTEEHVGAERPLVGLVHNDRAVVVQVGLPETLPQQNTVRHVLDHRVFGSAVLETYGVADFVTCGSTRQCGTKNFYKILPNWVPISSLTRFATDIAATLLGWVHPIMPYLLYPSSCRYWVSWVVLPLPVSPRN
jgi:hypothetical protein